MLLAYAKEQNAILKQFEQRVIDKAGEACLERFTHLEPLFQRLNQPRLNLRIGVFVIEKQQELDELVGVKEQLTDMRLVVVLADKDPQTLAKVHGLSPRFITFTDAGVAPLVSVVEKMMVCQMAAMSPPAAERTISG